ncbi:hypothetical protein Agub_g3423, partial [Astrephomene gubernaculifera]
MHFTTSSPLSECKLLTQQHVLTQRSDYAEAELTFSFTDARRGGRNGYRAPVLASLSLSRTRGQHGPRNILASLTGITLLFQGRDAGLRKTFDAIDVDGKGHITEKDLEAFANRNGLPSSYAAHFANAVRANAVRPGTATAIGATADSNRRDSTVSARTEVQQCVASSSSSAAVPSSQEQQRQQHTMPRPDSDSSCGSSSELVHQQQRKRGRAVAEDAEELTYGMFRQFVRSREEALRRAFNLFDQDGDGRISVADLDASLSRVAVGCPQTRCVLRCSGGSSGSGSSSTSSSGGSGSSEDSGSRASGSGGGGGGVGGSCRSVAARHLHAKAATEQGSLGFPEFRDFFLLLPQQDMLVEYWVAAEGAAAAGTGAAAGSALGLSDKQLRGRAAGGRVGGGAAGRRRGGGGGSGGAAMVAAAGVAAAAATGRGAAAAVASATAEAAKGSPWGHLLAGAVAGAASRTATAPLETLRLAAMAGQLQSRSLVQAAQDILSSQGWPGLYRGNFLNVLKSAPQKALDFFAFDAFKRLIGEESTAQLFLAAGLAGCTSWVVLYPLEVVRSRVTVAASSLAARSSAAAAAAAGAAVVTSQCALPGAAAAAAAAASTSAATARAPGLLQMLTTIVRQEGPMSLYRGLGASVAAIFPEAAITYGLHDALKKSYTRITRTEPGVVPSLAFGVFSAFMGQLVSFPLETVSRRLQVAAVPAAGAAGTAAAASLGGLGGVATVVRGLLAEGGPAAFYRGIGAATLRLIPMACVSFGTYEAVRALLVAWEQQREERQAREKLHARCMPLVLHGPRGDPEVVGRVCTPPGAAVPALCSTTALYGSSSSSCSSVSSSVDSSSNSGSKASSNSSSSCAGGGLTSTCMAASASGPRVGYTGTRA